MRRHGEGHVRWDGMDGDGCGEVGQASQIVAQMQWEIGKLKIENFGALLGLSGQ